MRIEFFPEGNQDCRLFYFTVVRLPESWRSSTIVDYLPRASRPRLHFTNLLVSFLLATSRCLQRTRTAVMVWSNCLTLYFAGVGTEKVGLKSPTLPSQ
jgi:hypothetical protein